MRDEVGDGDGRGWEGVGREVGVGCVGGGGQAQNSVEKLGRQTPAPALEICLAHCPVQ